MTGWAFVAWFAGSFVFTVVVKTTILEIRRRRNERDHRTPYDAPKVDRFVDQSGSVHRPDAWPPPGTDKRITRF